MEKLSINVLIVDDEPASLEQSRESIALYVEASRIHTAANSVEVMGVLQSTPIALAFVDIEMADTDGFSVAGYLQSVQPKARYVFLTGHAELGAKSYDYEPLDFLCKPVSALRLKKTFERYEKAAAARRDALEQIAVETTGGFVLLSPAEILYVTRERRKVTIYCEKQSYPVSSSLEELELILEEFGLFRCHQSYLVSLSHVAGVAQSDFGRTYWAVLRDGQRVPVSRSKYGAIQERMRSRGVQFL